MDQYCKLILFKEKKMTSKGIHWGFCLLTNNSYLTFEDLIVNKIWEFFFQQIKIK